MRRPARTRARLSPATLFVLPAGRVLTTLKAPDERADATLPQVLPPLPAHGMRICPSSTEACCLAQFVFDFDAVKALLGDDRSFALEILVCSASHTPLFSTVPSTVHRLNDLR